VDDQDSDTADRQFGWSNSVKWSRGGTRRALRLARAALFQVGGINRRRRNRLDGSHAALLMYHRVMPAERARRDSVEDAMFVTPETFARHCDWLAENFRVLPLSEIAARMAGGHTLPPGACAITFDDGWRDNLEFAVPVLKRRSFPATVFVVSERVGGEGAFWPDEVCRRFQPLDSTAAEALLRSLGIELHGAPADAVLDHLKACDTLERERLLDRIRTSTAAPAKRSRELLNWRELDNMANSGIEVESHGATHAILTGLEDEDMERELRVARDALHDRGHGQGHALAYPSGAHDRRVLEAARRLGYRTAVTTLPGIVATSDDQLRWPRIGIHEDISRSQPEFLYAVPGRV
jgi:peptidoglycan/xylan/chitin deacetylase (PgdA/CDA1 family)